MFFSVIKLTSEMKTTFHILTLMASFKKTALFLNYISIRIPLCILHSSLLFKMIDINKYFCSKSLRPLALPRCENIEIPEADRNIQYFINYVMKINCFLAFTTQILFSCQPFRL